MSKGSQPQSVLSINNPQTPEPRGIVDGVVSTEQMHPHCRLRHPSIANERPDPLIPRTNPSPQRGHVPSPGTSCWSK
eukprot:767624-Rhodomonas_salina.1